MSIAEQQRDQQVQRVDPLTISHPVLSSKRFGRLFPIIPSNFDLAEIPEFQRAYHTDSGLIVIRRELRRKTPPYSSRVLEVVYPTIESAISAADQILPKDAKRFYTHLPQERQRLSSKEYRALLDQGQRRQIATASKYLMLGGLLYKERGETRDFLSMVWSDLEDEREAMLAFNRPPSLLDLPIRLKRWIRVEPYASLANRLREIIGVDMSSVSLEAILTIEKAQTLIDEVLKNNPLHEHVQSS